MAKLNPQKLEIVDDVIQINGGNEFNGSGAVLPDDFNKIIKAIGYAQQKLDSNSGGTSEIKVIEVANIDNLTQEEISAIYQASLNNENFVVNTLFEIMSGTWFPIQLTPINKMAQELGSSGAVVLTFVANFADILIKINNMLDELGKYFLDTIGLLIQYDGETYTSIVSKKSHSGNNTIKVIELANFSNPTQEELKQLYESSVNNENFVIFTDVGVPVYFTPINKTVATGSDGGTVSMTVICNIGVALSKVSPDTDIPELTTNTTGFVIVYDNREESYSAVINTKIASNTVVIEGDVNTYNADTYTEIENAMLEGKTVLLHNDTYGIVNQVVEYNEYTGAITFINYSNDTVNYIVWLNASQSVRKIALATNDIDNIETSELTEWIINLSGNTTYRNSSPLTSLQLNTSSDVNSTLNCQITFMSDVNGTTLVDNIGIYFTGDECNDGIFTPIPDVIYDIAIWANGFAFQGVVRGVTVD